MTCNHSIRGIPYTIDSALKGKHNLVNIAVALYIYQSLGYDSYDVFYGLVKNFTGLQHRLSFVKEVDSVAYYNDSISTIPQASIAAVEAIDTTQTLILGGMNRGIDYGPLIEFINRRLDLKCILMPDTGHLIYESLKDKKRLYVVDSLKEAVDVAWQVTTPGRACLLSPAAPSYGFFKNFEDRGIQFENLIQELTPRD